MHLTRGRLTLNNSSLLRKFSIIVYLLILSLFLFIKVAPANIPVHEIPDTSSDLQSAADIAELLQDTERFHIEVDSSGTVPENVKSLVAKYLESQAGEQQAGDRETVVTIWDFAGQHLYYASHPVFLSPRAIYVLVYNLSKELSAKMEPCVRQGVHDFIPHSSGDETNLDSILSWLVSVHNLGAEVRAKEEDQEDEQPYLRPPVIIVGTHADNPFEDPKRMETQIKKSLSGKTYEQHVRRPFYRVDNTRSGEDEGVLKIRQEIREVTMALCVLHLLGYNQHSRDVEKPFGELVY